MASLNPTELNPHERTVIFHKLLNHLDASQRMVVTVADTRWHVAVTRFRQGWQDGGLTRAFSRYLTGLFLRKDDAITDLVEKVNLFGHEQDVLVSWTTSAEALREELLVIQGCLNAAGILDDRQPLDFDFGADFSAHALGAGIHYDNQTGKVDLHGDVDPGKLLAGLLSARLTGRLGFTLRKNHLKDDPRLPMMAGIIALETMTSLSCSNMNSLMLSLSTNRDVQIREVGREYAENGEQQLRTIFAAIKPEVEKFGAIRGTVFGKNGGKILDSILYNIFEERNFAGAFNSLVILHDVFKLQNEKDPLAQKVWILLSASVYLGAQISTIKSLLHKPQVVLNNAPGFGF
jgi:hypothetical protein